MKNLCLLTLVLPSIALASIYGSDDRRDIYQVPQLTSVAKSVAIAVPLNFMVQNRDGSWLRQDAEPMAGGSDVYACPDVRFAKQPIAGNASGFLVGKRQILTAGHVILPNGVVTNDKKHPFCDSFGWVLAHSADAQSKTFLRNIPAKNFYRCKRVIRAENTEQEVNGVTTYNNDFALVELVRDVPAEFVPLKLKAVVPGLNERVFTIGHPSGLPAKYSGLGPVTKNSNKVYFEAPLDTQSGNSGGPVFDEKNFVRGILVSGHAVDYVMEPSGCYKPNTCNANGSVCRQNSPFPGQQTVNYVQNLAPVLPWLKK